MLLQSLYFSLFLPNRPRPLSSFDTHARWQPVTQSARSRWSYGKIEDCEQSTIYHRPSTLDNIPSTVDILPSTLDKNLHSKSTYFLKLTYQERVIEVQRFLKRTNSRPQSRFLVTWSWNEGLWRQPLPDVRKFRTSGHACAEVTNITAYAHNGFLFLAAPLGTKFYFLSSLQTVASLGCFENTDFTQLGFIVKLESKGDGIKKKKPAEHTLGCAERRQLIGRLSSAFNMCVHVWRKQTLRKQDRRDGKLV